MKILIFNAIWCPSCLFMRPRFEKVFSSYDVVEYDYDLNNDLVIKYNIGKIIPVVIIFKDDVEIKRIIGEKSIKELESIIEDLKDENSL